MQIVGKTNLHELRFGATGVNHYGTPTNPLDLTRSRAVRRAARRSRGHRQADVVFGTDTAGSVRNPAGGCGVAGLKTTRGRIPLDGLWPLAPSMDTVGPLARNVAGVTLGMVLLDPDFAPASTAAPLIEVVVGRFRGVEVDPRIDAAVDAALAAAGFDVCRCRCPGGRSGSRGRTLMYAEALAGNAALVAGARDRMGADVAARFEVAAEITDDELAEVVAQREEWPVGARRGVRPRRLHRVLPSYPAIRYSSRCWQRHRRRTED